MVRHPPDILITTPESLYLMLTSQAREIFDGAEQVIVDEIHAVAQTKRGAHLALTLERLAEQAGSDLQRIGLSATQNPLEEVGRFLVGPEAHVHDRRHRHAQAARPQDPRAGRSRWSSRSSRDVDLDPFAGQEATRKSIWPAIYPELLQRGARAPLDDRLRQQPARAPSGSRCGSTSSQDPTTARGMASRSRARTTARSRARSGSSSRSSSRPASCRASSPPRRSSSGIDMGAVDLVLQVESPKSVTAGLQRIGRAGHGVGDISKGRIFPKFRADLLECAVVAQRMREGLIERTVVPRNPLDVLAQQIVAIAASSEDPVARRRAARAASLRTHSFAELSRAQLENVLDMLDGRYPSEEFGELRPRIVWDRVGGHDPRAQGRPRAGDHERRHDPRPRAVLGQPARRPPRRRARRGDGLRGAPGPGVPARRVELADRGHHARPRRRHARARRAGRGAVLEGRRRRAAARARRGDRRVLALGGRAGRRDARRRLRPRPARRAEPASRSCASSRTRRAWSRATARSWSSASATRSATGACASSRPSAAACTPPGGSR